LTDAPKQLLQSRLLDLLSTHRSIDPDWIAELGQGGWQVLLGMARQHRVLPLLHWRLSRERVGLPVPQPVRERLAIGFRRSAMNALHMQRELILIHRVLDGAQIPHLALKGAYLAFYAYPHPALRPMRDLDVLVQKETALRAYQALSGSGFTRMKKVRGNLEAVMEGQQHLPPLVSASTGVRVELHTRFSKPVPGSEKPDLTNDDLFWERAIKRTVAGASLTYTSPTHLLLHLIDHAVYMHRLNNGPLALTDLAYLLEDHEIDWSVFWQHTERRSKGRGTRLVFAMVERYFGKQPVEWPQRVPACSVSPRIVEAAALLTTQDLALKWDTELESKLLAKTSLRGKVGIFLKKAFPSRRTMATSYPVREDSFRVYLWYIARWSWLLLVRLPEYLVNRSRDRRVGSAQHLLQLNQWLEG